VLFAKKKVPEMLAYLEEEPVQTTSAGQRIVPLVMKEFSKSLLGSRHLPNKRGTTFMVSNALQSQHVTTQNGEK
jgi:hypothetical protein